MQKNKTPDLKIVNDQVHAISKLPFFFSAQD